MPCQKMYNRNDRAIQLEEFQWHEMFELNKGSDTFVRAQICGLQTVGIPQNLFWDIRWTWTIQKTIDTNLRGVLCIIYVPINRPQTIYKILGSHPLLFATTKLHITLVSTHSTFYNLLILQI